MNIKKYLILTILLLLSILGLFYLSFKNLQTSYTNTSKNTNFEDTKSASKEIDKPASKDIFRLFDLDIKRLSGFSYEVLEYNLLDNGNKKELIIDITTNGSNLTLKIVSGGVVPSTNSNLTKIKDFGVVGYTKLKYGFDLSASSNGYVYTIFEENKTNTNINIYDKLISNISITTKNDLSDNQLKEMIDKYLEVLQNIKTNSNFNSFKPETKISKLTKPFTNPIGTSEQNDKIKISANTNQEYYNQYEIIPIYSICDGKLQFYDFEQKTIQLDCYTGQSKVITGFDFNLLTNQEVTKGVAIGLIRVNTTFSIKDFSAVHSE